MSPLLGQEEQAETLMAAARSGRMHHGWILAGPRGIGKASFARAAALRLLAEAAGPPPAGPGLTVDAEHPIARLIAAGSHPDYAELVRQERDSGELARNIAVDQVRGLQRLLSRLPSLSGRRVIVIDSADDLERSAANALLKNLEEPPAGTLFLLVAHAPARLLPTIRSRCRVLRFAPLDEPLMAAALRAALPDADPGEIAALVAAGEGSPGRAIGYAGRDLPGMNRMLREIAESGDPDNLRRLALAKSVSGKAGKPTFELLLERAPAFIAAQAKSRQGAALRDALEGWDAARRLASGAIILSLDPATVAFELGTHVATLAASR
ncbi:DNA polymerase III subunit delta' [Sphingobium aquiterrae]|uniref:DNA polymerase III subunit delta' n=1 Tax=Sphingobium aquiterrae TaxID=2038656 RepID=UPI00301961CA